MGNTGASRCAGPGHSRAEPEEVSALRASVRLRVETDCSVTIELPWPPNELSGHHNAHWRVLQPIKKKHRAWAAMATLAADIPEPEGNGDIRVSATFYPPDKRTDRVNMPTRLKPYWDGIADALKVNDRRFLPTYHFAEPVSSARVVITVYAT